MTPVEVKAIVRYRDGFRCTKCGITNDEHVARFGRSLDVHRTTPGSVYTVEGCTTLCRRCHKMLPKRPRGQPDLAVTNGRITTGIKLLPGTLAKLDEIADRMGWSRNATAERLIEHSDTLTPETIDWSLLPPDHRGKRGQGRRKRRPAP